MPSASASTLARVVAGCVDGYRARVSGQRSSRSSCPPAPLPVDGAPDLIAQMLDKLVANAVEFGTAGAPIVVALARDDDRVQPARGKRRAAAAAAMHERLFDSMVSVRAASRRATSRISDSGLYIVRLIAGVPRRHASAPPIATDGDGVVVSVSLPLAA